MAMNQQSDHALFSTEGYRSKDRELLHAEQVREAAEEEIRVWNAHRMAEKEHGRLFDAELPATG